MHSLSRTTLLGLAMLSAASSVTAVSLSSFTPRLNNLPPLCQGVYTLTIDSCRPEDFGPGARCSAACVQGLVKITEAVLRGCATVDVGETSIIGVFQNGIGIQALCPGVQVTTISNTATSTRASSQIRTIASTTSTSTSIQQTTILSSSTTGSASSSTGAIATDPNATSINAPPTNVAQPPPPPPPPNRSSAAASATQRVNSQLSNANSGGGSPFDVVAVGSSAKLRTWDTTLTTFLAFAFLFMA